MNIFQTSFQVIFLCLQLRALKSFHVPTKRPGCDSFDCGALGNIEFPFTNSSHPDCGIFVVENCAGSTQRIKFKNDTEWYDISSISQSNSLTINDRNFDQNVWNRSCGSFNNLSLPTSPYFNIQTNPSIKLVKCSPGVSLQSDLNYTKCDEFNIYYNRSQNSLQQDVPKNCSVILLPSNTTTAMNNMDIFSSLPASIHVRVEVSEECSSCYFQKRGKCKDVNGKFHCADAKKEAIDKELKLNQELGSGMTAFVIICILVFVWFCRKAELESRNICALDLSELQSISHGLPIYSYQELEKATNHFDFSKELGDGGFGTVYHGILQDGTEVAVKRLHENTFKRVKRFMNEVEILTRLRHTNLVTLYGCTSHLNRELLLLYEYVPNRTVAYHLHGEQAHTNPLSWSTRISIAIETASALSYLHASCIIHRDVKTANILLDGNYLVKLADFGLSRFFPSGATHITTAPQGTPGYLDPEYHLFYKLSNKSDVYSFGVVLIELISSLPAIDLNRQSNQINLANFASRKIQSGLLSELVDPSLGYNSDSVVKEAIDCVAELAFRCLQQDKDMRPDIDEVLVVLQATKTGRYKTKYSEEASEDIMIVKKNKTLEQLMMASD